jgi:phosphatidate cytidylyltransferase
MNDQRQVSPSLSADLKRRVPSAVALGLLALGVTWYGGFAFLLFWTAAALIVWYEWATVVKAEPRTMVLALGALAIAVAAILLSLKFPILALLAIIIGIGVVFVLAQPNANGRNWSAGGLGYAALAAIPIILLRDDPKFGFFAAIWIYAVVWLTDIAAYFCGKFIGGRKLAPAISPSKTWSGAIGGTLFGVLGGAMVATLANARFALMHIVIALIISVFSQAGDIFESFVKRKFGTKDSSGLLPGHGGVMDRLDAFIAACALALAIGLLRGGFSAPAAGLLQW